ETQILSVTLALRILRVFAKSVKTTPGKRKDGQYGETEKWNSSERNPLSTVSEVTDKQQIFCKSTDTLHMWYMDLAQQFPLIKYNREFAQQPSEPPGDCFALRKLVASG
ncbi:hypothetical protein B0H13DRAFT_1867518, partial [Mycena leptocephala]